MVCCVACAETTPNDFLPAVARRRPQFSVMYAVTGIARGGPGTIRRLRREACSWWRGSNQDLRILAEESVPQVRGGGIVFSCETGSGYASRFVLAAVAWGDGGMAQGLTAEPSDWRCVTGKSLLT